ncbi:MAG TPA: aminodeoxychorismate synthase component I [Deinococcales bacterium]|nr:aminodeoxychorismate synthase component I [Deinococcales bacterium]
MPPARTVLRPLGPLGSPREVMRRLAGEPGAFLLESAQAGRDGRWSFLGCRPAATLVADEAGARLTAGGRLLGEWRDPFAALDAVLARYRTGEAPAGPPFRAGLAGYLSYDLGRRVERLPVLAADDLGLPLLVLHLADQVLAHDSGSGEWTLATTDLPGLDREGRRADWEHVLERALGTTPPAGSFSAGPLASRTGDGAYLEQVRRVLELIRAGDVFQVNLSHRLEADFAGDPFALYERLARESPAPFATYLALDGLTIAGASPERFLRLNGSRVETRPIKGTAPRLPGDDSGRAALAGSAKDRAENLMIVDLLRNDLGRVAEYGSVRVDDLFAVEGHGPVWQMVSTVSARLRDGVTPGQLLRATMPGGSMTGAPKVRAMEVIEELEPVRRGPYAGAAGYLDLSGSLDLSIVIRTAVLRAGRVHVQVGGGIVADSTPEGELAETHAKAAALRRALAGP